MLKLPLVSRVGDNKTKQYFHTSYNDNVRSTFYTDDNSFESVMCFLDPRIVARYGESSFKCWFLSCMKSGSFSSMNEESKIQNVMEAGEFGLRRGLLIRIVYGTGANDYIQAIRQYVPGRDKSKFKYVDDVSLYIDKTGRSAVLIDEEKELTTVFLRAPSNDNERLGYLHQIVSCIPRLLPWLFKDNPATPEELALLKAFTDDTPDAAAKILQSFYDEQNFRKKEILNFMDGFCKNTYQQAIHDDSGEVSRRQSEINELRERINNQMKEMEALNDRIRVNKNKIARGERDDLEIIDYIDGNKDIHLLRKYDSSVIFGVIAPLENFDEDMFDSYVLDSDNEASYIYSDSPFSLQETKALFNAIWGPDSIFKMETYAVYKLDNNGFVRAYGTGYDPGDEPAFKDCIPNPHITYYDCIGGYGPMLDESAHRHDFVSALSIACQSARSINWGEECTVSHLMDDLFNKRCHCLVTEDGKRYTATEAVALLKERGIV